MWLRSHAVYWSVNLPNPGNKAYISSFDVSSWVDFVLAANTGVPFILATNQQVGLFFEK